MTDKPGVMKCNVLNKHAVPLLFKCLTSVACDVPPLGDHMGENTVLAAFVDVIRRTTFYSNKALVRKSKSSRHFNYQPSNCIHKVIFKLTNMFYK